MEGLADGWRRHLTATEASPKGLASSILAPSAITTPEELAEGWRRHPVGSRTSSVRSLASSILASSAIEEGHADVATAPGLNPGGAWPLGSSTLPPSATTGRASRRLATAPGSNPGEL